MSGDRVAIVTGASRGLGLALARELAAGGWRLVIDARGAGDLERAAGELRELTEVRALAGDICDSWHQAALIDAAGEGIDLLVNNASILGPSPQPALADYPLSALESVFRVNVLAPLALVQLALRRMDRGIVINITSDAAVEPYPGWGGYVQLKPALEASEPPEARGLARDEVRLMVAGRGSGEIVHTRFRELDAHLQPGDLLVLNTSATLPAAVPASRGGEPVEVRFSTRAPRDAGEELHVVELRSAGGEALLGAGRAGEQLILPGGARLELVAAYEGSERLWLARAALGEPLHRYLRRHGRPVRYGYVPGRWPLSAYQTAYATVPGSAEMASAGRPFTARLITRLLAHGVLLAPLVLHTGVSSPERHEPPYPEPYEVPAATARLVNAVRGWGGRVIAVGTTVVRTLETVAAPDGTVRPGDGWTDLVVCGDRGLRAVTGMITGWHEPLASHLQILEALAGESFIERCYASAVEQHYLWHEFGDSHLILP